MRDLSVDQCKTDGDCRKFGDYSCSSENVCVANMTNTSGSGSGGTESEGGTQSSGGTGGEPVGPDCTKNQECIDEHGGEPYICQEEKCVPLTVPDHCPYVVAGTEEDPTEYLTQPGKPIIFGAYVPMDTSNPEGHPYTLIYKFALEEFMTATLGGPGGRPLVMVLCQSTEPDLEASAAHLFDTLQVPGVLATLPSADLATLYKQMQVRPRPAFLLGPFEADSSLISLDKTGRLWHMLGPITDLVPAYVPLFELAENYVRQAIRTTNRDAPVKVAVINTDFTYSLDLANFLPSQVSINGHPLDAKENDEFYLPIQVKVMGHEGEDVTAGVVSALSAPDSADIIVSLGAGEFLEPALRKIQAVRKLVGSSPFYILSPGNAFDKRLTSPAYYMGDGMTFIEKISAGVNYASVENSRLYDRYLKAIQRRYQNQVGLESRENMYDAAYFMMYSLSAASFNAAGDFDGDDVVNGMKSVTTGSVDATVGLGEMNNMINYVLGQLTNKSKVRLEGTLGPPNFDALSGARNSPGSVWCITRPSGESPQINFDMLRLDPENPTQLKLSGANFCYPNFVPAP